MDERRAARARVLVARKRSLAVQVSALLVLAVGAAGALVLAESRDRGRADIESRFTGRAQLAAGFVSTYADQLMQREEAVAAANLSGSVQDYTPTVAGFGFPAAVLLDDQGRVLAITPAKPQLIGVQIASKYPHLAAAEQGARAVSPVVASAATGEPVVGFAVPFDTPSGRRVFSGAYAIRTTPLAAYLQALVTAKSAQVYLVDTSGTIVLSSTSTRVTTLTRVAPALAAALRVAPEGRQGDDVYVSYPARGTPWTVVVSTPAAALFAPVSGATTYLAWGALALLVCTALAVCLLAHRLLEGNARVERSNRELGQANRELDELAHLDPVTGVRNRRSAGLELHRLHGDSQRAESSLSVLMVDVDRFKKVNDTFGHLAGDDVLATVAGRLAGGLRQQDVLGRWGGEEFLVVLPDTDGETAARIGERLCAAVAHLPIAVGTGGDRIDVTVSVGVASARHAAPEVLVHLADQALYAAKSQGRNRVRTAGPLTL